MSSTHKKLVAALLVILAACAVLTRYGYYTVEGPILYRVDRWTGRVWIVRPDEMVLLRETGRSVDGR